MIFILQEAIFQIEYNVDLFQSNNVIKMFIFSLI